MDASAVLPLPGTQGCSGGCSGKQQAETQSFGNFVLYFFVGMKASALDHIVYAGQTETSRFGLELFIQRTESVSCF